MSSTAFFVISKLVGLGLRAETWLIVLALLAALAVARGWRRMALAASGLTCAALVTLTAVPVGFWAIAPLEARYPVAPPVPSPPDGILVLGGAVQTGLWRATGRVHLNDAGERMTEAALLARRFPGVPLVLTGGGASVDANAGGASEAEVMAALLTRLGVAPARLTLEERSRNTAENASFAMALARPAPGSRWLLITSAAHMPRAMETFAAAGWTGLTAWPTDLSRAPGAGPRWRWDLAQNLYSLNRAVKEYVGILGYRLTGRAQASALRQKRGE